MVADFRKIYEFWDELNCMLDKIISAYDFCSEWGTKAVLLSGKVGVPAYAAFSGASFAVNRSVDSLLLTASLGGYVVLDHFSERLFGMSVSEGVSYATRMFLLTPTLLSK